MTSDPGVATANDADPPAKRPAAYALFVAAGIFLSRISGLVRGGVLSYFLGTSAAMSAFQAALRIPNFLQNLLGEGVLSASMIPVYSRLLAEKDHRNAGRVAGTVASLLALVVAVIVVAGVLFAPLLVGLLAPGFEGETRALTIRIVRILFPGIGLLVISAWCLAVLNSHRRFFVPYVAPVLWNLAIIGALLIFGWGESADRLAVIAAWGTVAGAVLQLGIQVPFVVRSAPHIRFGVAAALEPVRQVFRNFVPVVISRGVVQVSAFIDEIFASFLGTAAMGAIGYAYMIYLLPVSLFGMSVSAAELPQMSSVVGSREEIYAQLRRRLAAGLRQITFFVVPSLVAFITIGNVLVAALYQRGRFDDDSTRYVWYILAGYALGLVPVTLARLYSSTFYAMNDTRTPLVFALIRVVLTAIGGYLLAFPLRPYLVAFLTGPLGLDIPAVGGGVVALGAVGLALASGIVGWLEFGLLRRALQRRIGAIPPALGFQAKIWVAAVSGALAALASLTFGGRALVTALLPPALRFIGEAGVAVIVFGLVYAAVTWLTGIDEMKSLARRFLRRTR
jgi:putative peptidoglycan lipid II flippase